MQPFPLPGGGRMTKSLSLWERWMPEGQTDGVQELNDVNLV